VSAAYVGQYLSANHARLLDIEGNSDGTFNIVLVASAGAWTGWWYGPDVASMVTMAARDDLRVLGDDQYATGSGTDYVILTIENNPNPAAMRTDVLTQSLDAYQAQDAATDGLLQFSDAADGTTSLTFGSVPVTARTRVGSISKTFVATAILMLEAEGKLSISDSIDRWLPGLVPNGANITLEELLNHSAGISNYTDELAFTPATMSQSFTPAQLVQIAVANPPYFAPGAGYHYSNTDYVLLAMVIEKVTGAYYGDFITSHIISPLGLTGTAVPDDTTIASPAMPGRWNDGSAVVTTTSQNASRWYGPGAVVSTVADVNTFYQALLSGRLLPAAQLAEMENDTVSTGVAGQAYGLGLIKTNLPCGVTIAWHNGYVMGYETFSAHSLTGSRNITWTYNAPGGPDANLDSDLAEAAFCRF
jgi:D-alanyl-D-alanine carboxypeptidase